MKYNILKCLFVGTAITLSAYTLSAQKCVNPNVQSNRLDYRDLGYPAATEIPGDDAHIGALLSHSNGQIYGATSGKQSYLFHFDSMTNKVYPLGQIDSEKGVHHCLVEGQDGYVYIGTGLNELEIPVLTKDVPYGRRTIEYQLWDDIKARYAGYAGGHIYVYNPSEGDGEIYLDDAKAKLVDLGIPVPGNSIYAMTINPEYTKIYGISYPDAIFFEFDIAEKKVTFQVQWLAEKSYSGPERSWRSVPRAILYASDGLVYSSGNNGLMYTFNPETKVVEQTYMRVPGEYWETQNYNGYPVVEQLIQTSCGVVYGTSSDGFLFRIALESQELSSLGKPRVERRVRAMTLGQDGRLYMICGEKDNVCRMFSYNVDCNEGFLDYGVLGVDRSPYYAKIAYQFDSMCTGGDGTIFIGESDRRGKLFFYVPGGTIVKGALNPTNPR